MYQHQDWKTVVLNKRPEAVVTKTVGVGGKSGGYGGSTSTSGKPAWKVESMVDSDVGKPVEYVSKEDGQKIVNGRVAMKLSQKDLAVRLNMPLKDIQDIESGRAILNKEKLGRIKRFLGV